MDRVPLKEYYKCIYIYMYLNSASFQRGYKGLGCIAEVLISLAQSTGHIIKVGPSLGT